MLQTFLCKSFGDSAEWVHQKTPENRALTKTSHKNKDISSTSKYATNTHNIYIQMNDNVFRGARTMISV